MPGRLSLAPMCWRRGKEKETTEAEGANIFWRSTLFSSYRSSFSTGVPPVSLHLRAKSLALLGCAPKRAFCEADVPEGPQSSPLGLGAVPAPFGGLTLQKGDSQYLEFYRHCAGGKAGRVRRGHSLKNPEESQQPERKLWLFFCCFYPIRSSSHWNIYPTPRTVTRQRAYSASFWRRHLMWLSTVRISPR